MTPHEHRVAFLHTSPVSIAPVMRQANDRLPDCDFVNYLDDRVLADLEDPVRATSIPERLADLARAAKSGGAEMVMLTCSSISDLAAATSSAAGLPVLRIDEAMADAAVLVGSRIAVLATLPTTLRPTLALLSERAQLANRTPTVLSEVVDGAFALLADGDREGHDHLVADAIRRTANHADVIVLAQASMASAAAGVVTGPPILTSLALGIERLSQRVSTL